MNWQFKKKKKKDNEEVTVKGQTEAAAVSHMTGAASHRESLHPNHLPWTQPSDMTQDRKAICAPSVCTHTISPQWTGSEDIHRSMVLKRKKYTLPKEKSNHIPTKMEAYTAHDQESLGQDTRDGYLWGLGTLVIHTDFSLVVRLILMS